MSRKAGIHIGTSGWTYPHWRGRFYPRDLAASNWFDHYSDVFDTVEINNTFYHLPGAKTFNQWQQQAPRRFTYAVKANRYITHMKNRVPRATMCTPTSTTMPTPAPCETRWSYANCSAWGDGCDAKRRPTAFSDT